MFTLVALGELLIDFTPGGKKENDVPVFSCNPGGAPANVLAMFAKLGGSPAFIGKVGDDDFGHWLKLKMEDSKVNVDNLIFSKNRPTTLAFVHLDNQGNRSFSFYRKHSADLHLKWKEINRDLLDCKFFHFGSVSMTERMSRSVTLKAAKTAKKKGAIISYDPNYRPLLWENEKKAYKIMRSAFSISDIVKVSLEEMELLTGTSDIHKGIGVIREHGPSLVIVTLGPEGAAFMSDKELIRLPAFDVNTIDTTGAGDAFWGSFLWSIKDKTLAEIKNMPSRELSSIVRFANAAGSLATTKKGAIPSFPDYNQIKATVDHGAGLPGS